MVFLLVMRLKSRILQKQRKSRLFLQGISLIDGIVMQHALVHIMNGSYSNITVRCINLNLPSFHCVSFLLTLLYRIEDIEYYQMGKNAFDFFFFFF